MIKTSVQRSVKRRMMLIKAADSLLAGTGMPRYAERGGLGENLMRAQFRTTRPGTVVNPPPRKPIPPTPKPQPQPQTAPPVSKPAAATSGPLNTIDDAIKVFLEVTEF